MESTDAAAILTHPGSAYWMPLRSRLLTLHRQTSSLPWWLEVTTHFAMPKRARKTTASGRREILVPSTSTRKSTP